METTLEQPRRAAEYVAKALAAGARKKEDESKLAAKEELFRNSLGVRLKKPKTEMNPNTNFFKIILIAFLVVFLFLLYRYSENGRYQQGAGSPFIIDTRTGKVFSDVRKK